MFVEVMDAMSTSSFEVCRTAVNTSSRSSERSSRVGTQNPELNPSGTILNNELDCIAEGRMILELTRKDIQRQTREGLSASRDDRPHARWNIVEDVDDLEFIVPQL